jgi:protein involved in polysaccharide export with SLBB domain
MPDRRFIFPIGVSLFFFLLALLAADRASSLAQDQGSSSQLVTGQTSGNGMAQGLIPQPVTGQTSGPAQGQGAASSLNDETMDAMTARFLSLNPQERKARFDTLNDGQKRAIFDRLDDFKKGELVSALSDDEKVQLFSILGAKEQEKWRAKYPDLFAQTNAGVPSPVPVETPSGLNREAVPPPSRIEDILSGHFPTEISRNLQQYGYDFFDRPVSTFAPVTDVPVGPDYAIGPGDQFTIHLWGKVEESYEAAVTRDGTIVLPRVGSLDVSGLTYAELKKFLYHKFKQYYPDFQMSITMGRLRTVQIFLVGEAKNPGTYAVSSLSTVISALSATGGPDKNGSLRNIKLFRAGRQVVTLDLYDFFIHGLKNKDVRLQPGDTIFIPVLGPVVGVAGNVRRPAIYELRGRETIGDVIALAGGVMATGYLQNVQIERIVNHQRRVVVSFNLDSQNEKSPQDLGMLLHDGDVVKIYPVYQGLRQVVYLEGHVKYPREYELKPGMHIKDIISSYDDLLPDPYLPEAQITRLVKPDLHPETVIFNLGALLSGDESQNLKLEDQDLIKVFSKEEKEELPTVTIEGAVQKPGTYRLLEHMTIKDLIFEAGNLKTSASMKRATLSRLVKGKGGTDVAKIEFSPDRAIGGFSPDNMTLKPDDTVHIREIPLYHQALQRKVYLEGEFRFPGEYTYSAGERLRSVIERAGGLSQTAYPFGALFYRESAKGVQKERLNDYINKLEEDILTTGAQSAETALDKDQAAIMQQALVAKKQLLSKLKQAQPTGRMVIKLQEVLASASSSFNFELRPGDRLVVPKQPEHVNVLGEVYNPTALLAEKGKTVGDYLQQVGGPTDNAEEGQIYVVRADGEVLSKAQEGFFGMAAWDSRNHRWTMGGFDNLKLVPGDTIIVPRKVEKYPWLGLTKDITQILYQIAVTAGVILVVH